MTRAAVIAECRELMREHGIGVEEIERARQAATSPGPVPVEDAGSTDCGACPRAAFAGSEDEAR